MTIPFATLQGTKRPQKRNGHIVHVLRLPEGRVTRTQILKFEFFQTLLPAFNFLKGGAAGDGCARCPPSNGFT